MTAPRRSVLLGVADAGLTLPVAAQTAPESAWYGEYAIGMSQ